MRRKKNRTNRRQQNQEDIGVDRATNAPLENMKPQNLACCASHRHKTFLFPAPKERDSSLSAADLHHSSKRNPAAPKRGTGSRVACSRSTVMSGGYVCERDAYREREREEGSGKGVGNSASKDRK